MTAARELLVGWGELLWDVFPEGRRLGGAPASFVYHAIELGNRALLISRVGRDEAGEAAIAELQANGVDTTPLQRDWHRATGSVVIDMVAGEPRYRFATDVAWDHLEIDRGVEELLAQATLFCFGTLAQRTAAARDTLQQALALLPPSCVRLCDLNLRPPHDTREVVAAALEGASVVKLGEEEVARVTGLLGVRDVASWLLGRGVELVAVTRGRNGSLLLTRDERHEHAGFRATPGGDPVGAGDAFTAVLAHHLVRGSSLPVIAEAANRYAAHVASCAGAMPHVPAALCAAAAGVPAAVTAAAGRRPK